MCGEVLVFARGEQGRVIAVEVEDVEGVGVDLGCVSVKAGKGRGE